MKLTFAAVAALALATSPAIAGSPSVDRSASVSLFPVSSVVDQYYASHNGAPIWLRGQNDSAARELVEVLRRAPLDGLQSGPALADRIEAALVDARQGDRGAVRNAERLMSSAWALYVRAVNAPTGGMIYGDRAVAATAPSVQRILAEAASAPSLAKHVDAVSEVNPVYGKLRDAAWRNIETSGATPSTRIMANLDRVRSLPARGRFVMVDAASQRLWMYENGQVKDSMKVVVGKPEYATPLIASMIYYATVNPYWHVPDHLVRLTIAPNVLRQGTAYLKQRGYEVVSEWDNDASIISPDKVDWKAAAAGTAHVKIRQLPGKYNAMGTIKFPFANGEGIYLHDTPDKTLFAKDQRTLSNGCVRLEDAPRLARWLFGSTPHADGAAPEQYVALPGGVPVYITYLTAQAQGGSLTYRDDVYDRDGTVAAARVASIN